MSKFRPTEAQKRAIESIDRSVCVRAGAGTGKTSVLVGRYMELLRRKQVSVREIAALTYTEKAAKVMKDRIRRECLEEEMRARGEADAARWRRQRIDLETASIGTIHSFCSHILSERPVEAGVDPYFTVLDEVAQSILVQRSIDDVVRQLLEEQDAGVLWLCRQFSVADVCRMLTKLASNRPEAERAIARMTSRSDAEIIDQWRRLLKGVQVSHVDGVLAEAGRRGLLKRLAEAECTDPTDKLEPVRREVLRLAEELAETEAAERKIELAAKLRDTADNLRVGSASKWAGDGRQTVRHAFRAIRDMLDEVPGGGFDRPVGELDEKSLEASRRLIRLYESASESYEREKAEGGYLDFDDLLLRAREVLAERSDVRSSVRNKVHYLLVDELQDSALIERDIIHLIVRDEKKFARSGKVRILPGKLFVVGDDKQSIYRFRGAEVTVFREFNDRLAAEGDLVDLDVSFRTVPRGVAFANDFFGRLLGRREKRRPYESRYIDLRASRAEPSEFLEVMIPEPGEGEIASEARAREARMIASRVTGMVSSGEKLVYDPGAKSARAVTYGDVAVLFRAMTEARIYEHAFRGAGVPYYILAGSGFFRVQEVLDMLTVLRCLERPRDQVALLGTLRSPLFGISDETLFFAQQQGSIRQGLERAERVANITDDQRQGLIDAREILRELRGIKNRVPISRLLEEILGKTGYDAVLLAQFMGRQKLANVEKLTDLARSFEAKGLFTLDEFIRYIEAFVEVEARESERAAEEEASNVVRMMSVHRAKGLEFPVVFVADLSHEIRPRTGRVLFDGELGLAVDVKTEEPERRLEHPVLCDLMRREDKLREEAEKLRLLYVALTRARDYLVLSGPVPRSPKIPCWMNLLAKQYDLIDDRRVTATELVFGEARHRAPVRTEVPEIPEDEVQRRRRAGWKVVERLQRLPEQIAEAKEPAAFKRREYVEPLKLELHFKRRFIPSEFAEYRYCPKRYKLSKIDGILPADVKIVATEERPDGLLLGTIVHGVLAAWDFDVRLLAETIARILTGAGLAGTDQGEKLRAEAERMITSAEAAGLFADIASSAERLREYPLAARIGDFVIDGKLDDAHRLPDGSFEIVDYKTDWVSPDEIVGKAEHYELQLASYAVAFAKSGRDVSCVSLLFVRPGKPYTWNCDTKQLNRWEVKLKACVADIRRGRFEQAREGPCHCGYCGWLCDREKAQGDDLELKAGEAAERWDLD